MVIEGAPGLGEAIVSGEVTPDHYVVSRDDGAVVESFIPDEERGRVLSDAGTGRTARRSDCGSKRSSDLHRTWNGASRAGELLLLQSRPITTLGAHG